MSLDTTVRTSARRPAGARRGLLLTLAVAWALPAWVLPTAVARAQDADELFREGVTLREAGDSAAAVDRLRRAHRIDPAPRTTYNLAAALADHGRYVEAQLLLRNLVTSEDDLLIHDAARDLLDQVTPRIAVLGVEIVGGVSGQRLVLDGSREVSGARELAIDPGSHRIEVRSPEGSVLARTEVDLEPGERTSIVLRPVTGASVVTGAEDTQAPGARVSPGAVRGSGAGGGDGETWMWVGLGAGIVVVIGGVIAGTVWAFASQSSPAIDGDLPEVHVRGEP